MLSLLGHPTCLSPTYLHQCGHGHVKDADSPIFEPARQLVVLGVVGHTRDHLAGGVKLIQLLVGVEVPDAHGAVG